MKEIKCSLMQTLIHIILAACVGFLIGTSFVPFSKIEDLSSLSQLSFLKSQFTDEQLKIKNTFIEFEDLQRRMMSFSYSRFDMSCMKVVHSTLQHRDNQILIDFAFLEFVGVPELLISINGFEYSPYPVSSSGMMEFIEFEIAKISNTEAIVNIKLESNNHQNYYVGDLFLCYVVFGNRNDYV